MLLLLPLRACLHVHCWFQHCLQQTEGKSQQHRPLTGRRWFGWPSSRVVAIVIDYLTMCFDRLSLNLPSASPTCWGQRRRIKLNILVLPGNTHLKMMVLRRSRPAACLLFLWKSLSCFQYNNFYYGFTTFPYEQGTVFHLYSLFPGQTLHYTQRKLARM